MTIIETLTAAIKTIGENASGIVNAFDPPPAGINTADLPALYTFTGNAVHNDTEYGANRILVRRIFRVQVAVIPTGQGDPNTRETLCRPLLDNVLDQFRKYPTLGKTARIRKSRIVSDSGIVLLPEWGAKYIGFEIRIEVETIEPRTYAQGE